ncbi:MAG: hypothetical protein Q4G05_06855 [Clostridia bacterium]|nr:hypothetical protein [Clostridia bacterium]
MGNFGKGANRNDIITENEFNGVPLNNVSLTICSEANTNNWFNDHFQNLSSFKSYEVE